MVGDVDLVMTDHPGWIPAGRGGGRLRVLVSADGGRWLVQAGGPTGFTARELVPTKVEPAHDVFRLPPDALTQFPQLAQRLAGLGAVARFRAGTLWDALGAAAVRQMLRVPHATRLYHAFCRAHGEKLRLPTGDAYWLFPTPNVVLDLPAAQFAAVGLGSKRGMLRQIATSYLRYGHLWQDLPPPRLVDELVRIRRVGRWTAQAAVADLTNDWTWYPAGHLTLRTCANRAAPDYSWPTDERAFANLWRTLAGPNLGLVTVLTLAFGNRHADQTASTGHEAHS